MATRRIIDITKDGEKVWPKGHAKATFMSDGRSVEDAINEIPIGGEGGSITSTEIEAMGFTKNLGTITEVKMNGASKGTSGVIDLGKVITDVSDKQDKITDLSEIRSGAAAGATALQVYVTSFSVDDIYNAKYNDVGIEDAHKEDIVQAIKDGKKIATYLSELNGFYLADATLEGDEIVIIYPALNILIGTITTDDRIYPEDVIINNYITAEELAPVATSGSYNDLGDQPFIPNADNVRVWGFARGVKVNGVVKTPSINDGIVDLGTIEGGSGGGNYAEVEQLGDTLVANVQGFNTGNNVYGLPDTDSAGDADDYLVSRNTLKTINGQSLIGEGDMQTQYSIIELESSSVMIAPNVYNILPEDMQYDVSFGEGIDGVVNEYVFQCVAKNGGTLVLPDSVIWANGEIPPMTAGKIYVVSIVNNLAVYAEF